MNTPTIAVIDNDADLLHLLSLLFADQGWVTIPFTDGTVALEILRDAPPTVILLDLWLERTRSGWDVLKAVQADPVLGAIPIIICSGATDDLQDKEAWLTNHGIGVLPKPFDIDDLYAMVDAALCNGVKVHSPGSLAPVVS